MTNEKVRKIFLASRFEDFKSLRDSIKKKKAIDTLKGTSKIHLYSSLEVSTSFF